MNDMEQLSMSMALRNVVDEINKEVDSTKQGYPERMLHKIILEKENAFCVQIDHLVSIWETIIEKETSEQKWGCMALGCTWSPESMLVESEEGITLIDIRALDKTEENENVFLEGIKNFHYLMEVYDDNFSVEASPITKDELIPKLVETRNLLYEKTQATVH